jgi:hypothetical protein
MEEINIIATSTVQISPDGSWESVIPPSVPEGLHKIVVEDDMGNQDEALLYVDKPGVIDRITHVMPPVFGFSFLFFLLVILILAANNIRLGKIADESIEGKKKRKYLRHAMYFSVFMVVLSLIVGLTLNWGTSILEKTVGRFTTDQKMIAGSVTGQLIDADNMPVSGAVMTADDTVVSTSESGMFAFSSVAKEEGITISHPSVKRLINKEIREAGKTDILFDPSLMQSLVEVAELEARGDYRNLYKQDTVDAIKNGYSQDKYVNEYRANFTQADLSAGPIYVGSVTRQASYKSIVTGQEFPQVINTEVFTSAGISNYTFVKEQGKWKLVF